MGHFALALLSLCSWACGEASNIAGRVYCDQCIQGRFSTSTRFLQDAKLAVECQAADGTLIISYRASTNEAGSVSTESNACSVRLISSPLPSCSSSPSKKREQLIELSKVARASTSIKYTLPLSFTPEQPLAFCSKLAAARRLLAGSPASPSSSPSPVHTSPSAFSSNSPLYASVPKSPASSLDYSSPSSVYSSPSKSASMYSSPSPKSSLSSLPSPVSQISPLYKRLSPLVPISMILVFLMIFMIKKQLLMQCKPNLQVELP